LSLDIPKPLYPIAGKSNLEHMLENVGKIKDLKEILLLGFYESHLFDHFCSTASITTGVSCKYLHESGNLGTAGGMIKYRQRIWEGGITSLVVLHCDVCCSFPLAEILDFHVTLGKPATIMGCEVPQEHANSYGCLIEDKATHELLHYAEKPESYVSNLINAGIYVFSAPFCNDMEAASQAKNREPNVLKESFGDEEAPLSLEKDVIFPAVGTGKIFVYRYQDKFWRQIKNAGGIIYVTDLYTQHWARVHPERLAKGPNIIGNVVIDPTAVVDPTAKLGPNVFIGPRSVIGAGVRMKHVVISGSCAIKDHACLLFSIVADGCTVGRWARVEGVFNPTPNLLINGSRQGVTILAKDVTVSHEVAIYNCIVMPHKSIGDEIKNEIIL